MRKAQKINIQTRDSCPPLLQSAFLVIYKVPDEYFINITVKKDILCLVH